MPQFHVEDMTCKHCESTINQAIQALDAQAQVTIDLVTHAVIIESNQTESAIEAAIREAGFTPVLVSA